jgi:hypothetical protein
MTTRALSISLCVLLLGISSSAVAEHEVIFGPERTVIDPFVVDDYNDCTAEMARWNAVLTSFDFIHVSGKGDNQTYHAVSHFQWTAVVTGLTTGFVWETNGGGKDSIKYDDTDGLPYKEVFIENSVLKPITPGAPRIQFHALIRFRLDENGDAVADSVDYEYKCIGK